MSALVSLVGAGPGDAELLTLKAARRLGEADLVLYDGLVDPEALTFAAKARRFYVGKRAGHHGIEQETINHLMIRAARRGERVVRLKCGDPFVLGRGGEEALALAKAGIPFEVVPGVSSAIAGPALAGIPVTHRGIASGFLVLSGHAESAYLPILQSLAPNSVTVVVLMGWASRANLAQAMLQRGWTASTPAAIAFAAGTARSYTWLGALEELGGAEVPEEVLGEPATLCIGEVVSLSQQLTQNALQDASARFSRGDLNGSAR